MRTLLACMLFSLLGIKAFSQEPKLMLPIGHTNYVKRVVFSADGKRVLSASYDKTAKIWDFQSGLLIASLEGHSQPVQVARFSPDDNYILTLSESDALIGEGLIRIWDSKTYNLICNIGLDSRINSAEFSPDSKKIITVSADSSARIWDIATGALLTKCIGHFVPRTKVFFSTDNQYIAGALTDSTAGIWDAANGKLIRLLKEYTGLVTDISMTSDGTKIVTASSDSSLRIWNSPTGEFLFTLKIENANVRAAKFNQSGTLLMSSHNSIEGSMVKLWDSKTGKLIYTWDNLDIDLGFDFSQDGKKIIIRNGAAFIIGNISTEIINDTVFVDKNQIPFFSAYNYDGSQCVMVMFSDGMNLSSINFKTREIKKFPGQSIGTQAEHLSPDSKYLISVGKSSSMPMLWDMIAGKRLPFTLTEWGEDFEYSIDGKKIVVNNRSSVKIFDAGTGILLHSIKDKDVNNNFISAKFNSEGSKLVTLSSNRSVKIWDTKNYQLLKALDNFKDKDFYDGFGSSYSRDFVAFSPDNSKIVFYYEEGDNGNLVIWDVNTSKRITTLTGNTSLVNSMLFNFTESKRFSFSPDSKRLLLIIDSSYINSGEQVRRYVSNVKIWDIDKRRYSKDFKTFDSHVCYSTFSPDGKKAMATTMNGGVFIWDVQTTKSPTACTGHTRRVDFAEFSSSGKRLLTSSYDNSAKVWDVETGKLLLDLKGSLLDFTYAHFSKDGSYILTKSPDKTLKKWNALTGELMYTFFTVNDDDYLVVDKYGRYDGTPNARKLLYFTCDNEIIKLEQFEDLCWEPGLASKINGINKEPITAQKLTEISICNVTPEVIKDENAGDNYQYTIHPRNGGLGEVQLYVNGKLIKTGKKEELKKNGSDYTFSVKRDWVQSYFINGSANQVMVKATTGEGTMSSRGIDIQEIATGNKNANPNMYIISVGINKYKEEKIRLNYASTDAVSFGSAITASAKKLLNSDGKEHVISYTFSTETNSLYWPAKDSIQKKMEEIARIAKPEDILVFFFAGHGVLKNGQKNFYLLTAEATGFEMSGIENKVAISTDELGRWMLNIKANKQILIMDACNSGQGVSNLQELLGKRDIPADQVRALENLKDQNGTYILSASASGQSAYETSQFGQGLLTYSLLSGIKNQSALKENKYIDITQWFNNASNNVRTLAKEIGGRQEPQLFGNASFDVGLVDMEVMNGIKLSSRKKIFSRTKLFSGNPSLLLDPLQLEIEIDKQLTNFSFAGKESSLTFIENNVSPETYSIHGSYEIKGKSVTATLSLVKQNSSVKVFTETGSTEALDVFAKKIVTDISDYLKTVGSERIN